MNLLILSCRGIYDHLGSQKLGLVVEITTSATSQRLEMHHDYLFNIQWNSGVEEWIVAVVENRASTEDSLIAREAPVDGGVDGGPLRKGESV